MNELPADLNLCVVHNMVGYFLSKLMVIQSVMCNTATVT